MRFYTSQHRHYCGIDLHTKTQYVCILDRDGQVLVHKNLPSNPEAFLEVVAPYRDDLVVAVECIFTWYWLADLCAAEGIAFVLGHVRVSDHREHLDRAIVNTQIGIVNAKIGHGEHLDRAS